MRYSEWVKGHWLIVVVVAFCCANFLLLCYVASVQNETYWYAREAKARIAAEFPTKIDRIFDDGIRKMNSQR